MNKKNIDKIRSYITVVGGANVDIVGLPYSSLIMGDSNPGKTYVSLGGVGRNIAENLARLNIETKLITVLGDDAYGKYILEESLKVGLDMSNSLIIQEKDTSTYLCILNKNGDLKVAISSMDIFTNLNVPFIQSKKDIIQNSKLCVIDTNIPEEVLKYIVKNLKTDYFLDPVSTTKAKKVKDIIGYFHTIKPNKIEAEILSGITINSKIDLKRVSYYFLNKGVKRVFISLGEQGVYYYDGEIEKHVFPPTVSVKNATGAGDAFLAGIAYSYYNNFSVDETISFAIGASVITLEDKNTINRDISPEIIKKRMEEIKLC